MAVEAKTFQNFIDGEWVDAASGETFDSTSPATGELIGTFPKSGPEDVDRKSTRLNSSHIQKSRMPSSA